MDLETTKSRSGASAVSAFEQNFLDLLRLAAEFKASDLHLEPMDGSVRIRIRVDGALRTLQLIKGQAYAGRFFQQAKKVCGFDMGRLNVPQDRRFRADVVPFDLRASLIPSLYGEKIVLRLLQRGKEFSLDTYPLPEAAKADLLRILQKLQGLIIITGPTGCGKSTLLYSILSKLNKERNNVHTLEDPVEYELPGINQSSITPGEMSFAAGLRALMRQDPDVIMVGEIRDEETAKAAIHAAATGHLVLSTIHANSALASLDRLADLGIPYEQAVSNLLFASAQRLVPKNCPDCAQPDEESSSLVRGVFRQNIVPKVSRGCPSCSQTGVQGRALLFEYVKFMPAAGTGGRMALPQGSLSQHAFQYLEEGVINAEHACALE